MSATGQKRNQGTNAKIDVCHRCEGDLAVSGWLGGIEYRQCEDCRADHTWNVNKPWLNPAKQVEADS